MSANASETDPKVRELKILQHAIGQRLRFNEIAGRWPAAADAKAMEWAKGGWAAVLTAWPDAEAFRTEWHGVFFGGADVVTVEVDVAAPWFCAAAAAGN